MDRGRTDIATTPRLESGTRVLRRRSEAEVLEKETALNHERTERTTQSGMILRPTRFRKENVRYMNILLMQEVRVKVRKEVD
jgi:hypothetical protein